MRTILKNVFIFSSCAVLAGCAGVSKYEVLSFFFDGVPPPESAVVETTVVASDSKVASSRDGTDIITNQTKDNPTQKNQTTGSIHRPYKEKNCGACHNMQNMGEAINDLAGICAKCHESFREDYTFVHGPVAVDECSSCHDPHKSANKSLLKRNGDATCTFCHHDVNFKKPTAHQKIQSTSCYTCHNPHFSNTNRFFTSGE